MAASRSPYDEPRGGDYVAYLAELERRQLLGMTNTPPAADAAQRAGEPEKSNATPSAALTREQAQLLLQRLQGAGGAIAPATLVPGLVGLVLIVIGLALDSGWLFIAIGAYLIYVTVKSLRKRLAVAPNAPSPAQQIGQVFDVHQWGTRKTTPKKPTGKPPA